MSNNTHVTAKPPAGLQFFAGAVAGMTEMVGMYPLDLIKTLQQVHVGSNVGIVRHAQKIFGNSGIKGFYRGLSAPLAAEILKRSLKFGSSEFYQRKLKELAGKDESTALLNATGGMLTGLTEAPAIVTFELVKIQLQNKGSMAFYSSPADVVRHIYRRKGIGGFFIGLEATMWRHAVWNSFYFGSIAAIKANVPRKYLPTSSEMALDFVSGFAGGTLATMANCPMDVVKSRIQASSFDAPRMYHSTIQSIVKIVKNEGVGALYKGFYPKVIRMGPGGGILLLTYNQVISCLFPYFPSEKGME